MGSDAEYMYENDLDPLYRKDSETGELVEWEGGLNPLYEESNEENYRSDSDKRPQADITKFHTFQDAIAWSKENPGRSITKSPDGNGYIIKDSTSGSIDYNAIEQSNKQHGNIRPLVYEKIKNYLTIEQSEAQKHHCLKSMRITPKIGREILHYINENDLQTSSRRVHHKVANCPQGDLDPYTNGNWRLRINTLEVTRTPFFEVFMYFKIYEKNDDNCIMCLVKASGIIPPECYQPTCEINKEKGKKCKTILDLYFDILRKNPNDLIDIRFQDIKEEYHRPYWTLHSSLRMGKL